MLAWGLGGVFSIRSKTWSSRVSGLGMSGDPELSDDDQFRALCAAIGFVVLNWSVIEQQIDNIVFVAFKKAGGKAIRKNGDIPVSLKQKLDFLKVSFTRLGRLKDFREEGLTLIGNTRTLSDQRHDLVHAAITSTKPAETGGFTFRKIGYGKEDLYVHPAFTFDPSDFDKLGGLLGDHLTALIQFSQKLRDAFQVELGRL